MSFKTPSRPRLWTAVLAAVVLFTAAGATYAHATPYPAPGAKCTGAYTAEQVARYYAQARLALWLPGTRSVALNAEKLCVTVTVESKSDARLAALLLRSVAVPARAVTLRLSGYDRRDRG